MCVMLNLKINLDLKSESQTIPLLFGSTNIDNCQVTYFSVCSVLNYALCFSLFYIQTIVIYKLLDSLVLDIYFRANTITSVYYVFN